MLTRWQILAPSIANLYILSLVNWSGVYPSNLELNIFKKHPNLRRKDPRVQGSSLVKGFFLLNLFALIQFWHRCQNDLL